MQLPDSASYSACPSPAPIPCCFRFSQERSERVDLEQRLPYVALDADGTASSETPGCAICLQRGACVCVRAHRSDVGEEQQQLTTVRPPSSETPGCAICLQRGACVCVLAHRSDVGEEQQQLTTVQHFAGASSGV
jgi:hypothetical protein